MDSKSKVLHLTLFKKWFDLISDGKKKEEYREIKDYYIKRLSKKYDYILFVNGYGNHRPKILIEYKGIKIDKINNRYIIKLGNIKRRINFHKTSKK